MSKREQSVAPKERVNIVYKPAIGDQEEYIELPLRQLVLGEFVTTLNNGPIEERKIHSVTKDNFNHIMEQLKLSLSLNTKNKLSDKNQKKDEYLTVNLKFEKIKDFEPDRIAEQIPALSQLLELRQALKALKGPLGNVPSLRKKLHEIIKDSSSRNELVKELEQKK